MLPRLNMIRRRRQMNDNALTGTIPSELSELSLILLCVRVWTTMMMIIIITIIIIIEGEG